MNNMTRLIALLMIIFTNMAGMALGQTGEPWTSKDLLEPDVLAMMLNDLKA